MNRWKQWRHCPHANLHGIYGDAINHSGGWRLRCLDCGRYLAGPVRLAADAGPAVAERIALRLDECAAEPSGLSTSAQAAYADAARIARKVKAEVSWSSE